MENLIPLIITLVLSAVCAVISFFQFQEKGFLFNNAYLFASKQEREKMDKKPHYRQSAIVFALLSVLFLCIGLECIFEADWLRWAERILYIAVISYAFISSFKTS